VKTLLAIRHVPFEDLGSFALLLAEAGYTIRYVDAPTADFAALAKESPELLVVLGGPLGVNDAEDYPFVSAELKFVEARLKSALPLLGICLGSQFIAKALGAKVYAGSQVELGWKPLELSKSGQASPLRHLTGPTFHWHGEIFDLPKGAVHLASTDLCPNQGFSWGTNTLALQFHPEVTARGLEQWYVGNLGELRELKLSARTLRADSARHAPQMVNEGAAFLTEWLETL
jgi:GMP synthase (glutamine-hydrolysing)